MVQLDRRGQIILSINVSLVRRFFSITNHVKFKTTCSSASLTSTLKMKSKVCNSDESLIFYELDTVRILKSVETQFPIGSSLKTSI